MVVGHTTDCGAEAAAGAAEMQPQLLLRCSAFMLKNYCYKTLLVQVMPALMM
jgi:hypothetical protein